MFVGHLRPRTKKPFVPLFLLVGLVGVFVVMPVNYTDKSWLWVINLNPLEEVFDMHVGIWERVAAKYQPLCISEGSLCVMPDLL